MKYIITDTEGIELLKFESENKITNIVAGNSTNIDYDLSHINGKIVLSMKKIYEEYYYEGYEEGTEEGRDRGREEGHEEGRDQGHDEGYEEGFVDGRNKGYEEGYNSFFERTGIKSDPVE